MGVPGGSLTRSMEQEVSAHLPMNDQASAASQGEDQILATAFYSGDSISWQVRSEVLGQHVRKHSGPVNTADTTDPSTYQKRA
jgi:hypothetical protein